MNTLTPAGWHDFDDLPPRLQQQPFLARPRWDHAEFARFQFRVKPDGNISRMPGEHRHTTDEQKRMDAALRGIERPANPDKGDVHHLKTTSFGLNREPV